MSLSHSFSFNFRRVHITRATLIQLGDKFEVEPGNGANRESYLSDHKIETFLIIPPKVCSPMLHSYITQRLFSEWKLQEFCENYNFRMQWRDDKILLSECLHNFVWMYLEKLWTWRKIKWAFLRKLRQDSNICRSYKSREILFILKWHWSRSESILELSNCKFWVKSVVSYNFI